MKTPKEFAEEHQYDLEEHNEGGYLGINENTFTRLLNEYAGQKVNELNKAFVSNRREQLIAFCEFYKNSEHLFQRWTVEDIVGLYLKSN